jgi:phospholipase/carboxylesterase
VAEHPETKTITRRRFGAIGGGAFASLIFGGACSEAACTGSAVGHRFSGAGAEEAADGRLTARPRANVTTSAKDGRLGLDSGRDAILKLPATAVESPLPLLVLLHGASGSGEGMLRRLGAALDEAGIAVLSPDSRDGTWDGIRDSFGPDVAYLDRALDRVFETVSIDPARVAVGGFSDGATYALSLGLINGDLFKYIVAFSPGFIVNGTPRGKPQIFISHGTSDQILPIDQTSRVIVPTLRARGYPITFREFSGRHEVPPDIARDGLKFITGR